MPDALNPAKRVFVVASNLNVTAQASGQECSLTPGDVVMRISDAPDANQNVTASIQSSKKGDCATGQRVAIGVRDLQEMHNQFREQLDYGLKTLAEKSAMGGLPKAPDTATRGERFQCRRRMRGQRSNCKRSSSRPIESRRKCGRPGGMDSRSAIVCTFLARGSHGHPAPPEHNLPNETL